MPFLVLNVDTGEHGEEWDFTNGHWLGVSLEAAPVPEPESEVEMCPPPPPPVVEWCCEDAEPVDSAITYPWPMAEPEDEGDIGAM